MLFWPGPPLGSAMKYMRLGHHRIGFLIRTRAIVFRMALSTGAFASLSRLLISSAVGSFLVLAGLRCWRVPGVSLATLATSMASTSGARVGANQTL